MSSVVSAVTSLPLPMVVACGVCYILLGLVFIPLIITGCVLYYRHSENTIIRKRYPQLSVDPSPKKKKKKMNKFRKKKKKKKKNIDLYILQIYFQFYIAFLEFSESPK